MTQNEIKKECRSIQIAEVTLEVRMDRLRRRKIELYEKCKHPKRYRKGEKCNLCGAANNQGDFHTWI